jgi:Pyridoxal-phosphate dependent enzyme
LIEPPVDILGSIGNTSMVQLRKVVPPTCADIFVKLEWENPTGSLKDRMAQAVISQAEKDGRLKPGDTVVEYTDASTGASLALVCAVKGYRIRIVSSDAFSQEKLDQMAAFGAELTLIPSERGPHYQEADPGNDRGRAEIERRAEHLLDRPAQQRRLHRRIPVAGRRNLESNEGRMSYQSQGQLLGLPLLHVATGRVQNGRYRRGIARGWVAVGDIAFGGLVAVGVSGCRLIAMREGRWTKM